VYIASGKGHERVVPQLTVQKYVCCQDGSVMRYTTGKEPWVKRNELKKERTRS